MRAVWQQVKPHASHNTHTCVCRGGGGGGGPGFVSNAICGHFRTRVAIAAINRRGRSVLGTHSIALRHKAEEACVAIFPTADLIELLRTRSSIQSASQPVSQFGRVQIDPHTS